MMSPETFYHIGVYIFLIVQVNAVSTICPCCYKRIQPTNYCSICQYPIYTTYPQKYCYPTYNQQDLCSLKNKIHYCSSGNNIYPSKCYYCYYPKVSPDYYYKNVKYPKKYLQNTPNYCCYLNNYCDEDYCCKDIVSCASPNLGNIYLKQKRISSPYCYTTSIPKKYKKKYVQLDEDSIHREQETSDGRKK